MKKAILILIVFLISGPWLFSQTVRPPIVTSTANLQNLVWVNDTINKDTLIYFKPINSGSFAYKRLHGDTWHTYSFQVGVDSQAIYIRNRPGYTNCYDYKRPGDVDWTCWFCGEDYEPHFYLHPSLDSLFYLYRDNSIEGIPDPYFLSMYRDSVNNGKVFTQIHDSILWYPIDSIIKPDTVPILYLDTVSIFKGDTLPPITINGKPYNLGDSARIDTCNWKRNPAVDSDIYFGGYDMINGRVGIGNRNNYAYQLSVTPSNMGGGIYINNSNAGYGLQVDDTYNYAAYFNSPYGIKLTNSLTIDTIRFQARNISGEGFEIGQVMTFIGGNQAAFKKLPVVDTTKWYYYGSGIRSDHSIGINAYPSNTTGLSIDGNIVGISSDGSYQGVYGSSSTGTGVFGGSTSGVGGAFQSIEGYGAEIIGHDTYSLHVYGGRGSYLEDSLKVGVTGTKIGRTGSIASYDIWTGTQSQYDAISLKVKTTIYYIHNGYGWIGIIFLLFLSIGGHSQNWTSVKIGSTDITKIYKGGDVVWEKVTFVDTFTTITIGTQVWMKYNLAVNDGKSGIYYPNGVESNKIYGLLYSRDAAYRLDTFITGWHIPTYSDWETMNNYVGGGGAGARLSSYYSLWENGSLRNYSDFNKYQFHGAPMGIYNISTNTYSGFSEKYLWLSQRISGSYYMCMSIYYYTYSWGMDYIGANDCVSVRLIKD